MGLKPLLASNQFPLNSGMDNEALQKSVAMILKDDQVSQLNGSPLISPAAKPSESTPLRSPPTDMQPLRVDVNGYRQLSSTLVSPSDGNSSLVSTALPTPLMDFESNSNCSDSTVPQGDLYPPGAAPGRGAIDFGGFTVPKPSPGFPLRSPVSHAHLGPSTSELLNHPLSRPLQPPLKPPQPTQLANQAIQKRNGDIHRKQFLEKVSRHRGGLRFVVPRCGEANPSQLSIMLKKSKRHTNLPVTVEGYLFDEHPPELPKREPRRKKTLLEDPDITDDSDIEEDVEPVPYKRQRGIEKQLKLQGDISKLFVQIKERESILKELIDEYKEKYLSNSIVAFNDDQPAARCAPYIRKTNQPLIRRTRPFCENTGPSTSKENLERPYKESRASWQDLAHNSLHWMSMNPSFNIRKSLFKPPHLLDAKDLEEEMVRNGTARRMEKEKRRMKEETKNSRDSSDYEDTDEDTDYYPEPKGTPAKKKRKRGRPPRHERRDDDTAAPSKIGRKSVTQKHIPLLFENDLILDLTQIALSDEKPKYAQIHVPAFSTVSDESLIKAVENCRHTFGNLLSQHEHHHPLLEREEKQRYMNPTKKPARISVDKESIGEKTPLPSPVSLIKPTA